MNETTPIEESKDYEANVKAKYSELAQWGQVSFGGEVKNIYHDPELIRKLFVEPITVVRSDKSSRIILADYGGGEGIVVDQVYHALKSQGYENILPASIDNSDKNLQEMRKKFPRVQGMKGDLMRLPFSDDTVDVGILRFTLPYFNRDDQTTVLTNIHRSLKAGGRLIVLQDGAMKREVGAKYNELWAKLSAAQGGKSVEDIKLHRFFPSGEELRETAKSAGFKTQRLQELSELGIISYTSPKSYQERFGLDSNSQELLAIKTVFEQEKTKGDLEFSDDPNHLMIRNPRIYGVFEKIK